MTYRTYFETQYLPTAPALLLFLLLFLPTAPAPASSRRQHPHYGSDLNRCNL